MTPLAREALAIVTRALPAPILAHSLRTFEKAEAYARATKREHDEEGLYLAALFHDLGLARPDPGVPFQVASSRALAELLASHDVPKERVTPLVDAIDFHLSLLPRWSRGPEVGLLQVGAWMDVYGLRRSTIADDAARIDAAHPRVGFARTFHRALLSTLVSPAACFGLLFPGPYRAA